jgi:diguanylate cyclase (GGDEF)-like protein
MNNRRRLFELAETEFRRAQRYKRPLSIMLIDLDHFKNINDLYGHAAGDAALKWFAELCNVTIRQKVDIVGRFGGEEFAILYPETKLTSAIDAAKRLQHCAETFHMRIGVLDLKISFSAGIASLPDCESATLDQLIEHADKAMYAAKQKRNCLAYWDEQDAIPYLID